MSTKHTPGEWTVIVGTIITVGIDSKGAIAECRTMPTLGGLQLSRGEAIANAHLISAAPELLEACVAMLPIFDAFTQDELSITTINEAIALLPSVRAAIAKAGGVQ